MKKIVLFISILCVMFCFAGCEFLSNDVGDSNNTKLEEDLNDSGQQEDKLVLEDNTPQWWIDLFTFDNVTIFLKNNLTIKTGDTYKCVGGQWHKKAQNTTTFESHNGRYIFDLYLTHYSIFTFNSDNSYYEAHGVSFDNSNYTHDIYISINNNKITAIDDTCSYNTSEIWTKLDFSDYGITTLE